MYQVDTWDCGDGQVRADAGCAGKGPVAKTAAYQIQAAETGTIFTNSGAGGSVTLTLPAVKAGLWFRFAVVTAQNLLIAPSGGAKINNGSTSFGATTPAIGVQNCLVWCDGTQWFVLANGTWVTA